ncbi:MAG: hypothetical protein JSV22_08095 [Bacteroidales bacterium]|nr:MAG: hypothetical protein JSV22_08095 [Bacteroidales bacterium]
MRKTIFILVCICFIYSIVFSADLEFVLKSDSVRCYSESSGKITVNIISGNPGFTIRLYDKKPASKQKCIAQINTIKSTYTFFELPENNYYVTVEDSKGGYLQKTIAVYQPDKLEAVPITIEKCFSGPEHNDAILKANCTGGSRPYSYLWSENTGSQATQLANNIKRGTYRCVINDKNSCGPVSATIFFNEQVHKECFSNFE